MDRYRHTQTGSLLIAIVIVPVSVLVIATWNAPGAVVSWVAAAIVLAVALAFGRLTVTVTEREVVCTFCWGLVCRRAPIVNIVRAERVRNPIWYGWGIRLTPRGWLWNVQGLDAVELELKTGGYFRIGSDEPEALLAAIRRSRS